MKILDGWYLLLGTALISLSTYCIWGMIGLRMLGLISMMLFGVMYFLIGIISIAKTIKEKEERDEKNRTKS